jgi:hypothetical protein
MLNEVASGYVVGMGQGNIVNRWDMGNVLDYTVT